MRWREVEGQPWFYADAYAHQAVVEVFQRNGRWWWRIRYANGRKFRSSWGEATAERAQAYAEHHLGEVDE